MNILPPRGTLTEMFAPFCLKYNFNSYFFFNSDLKSRIAMEGDAITRAKEFLRRQRRSVQRRQVSVIFSFSCSHILAQLPCGQSSGSSSDVNFDSNFND